MRRLRFSIRMKVQSLETGVRNDDPIGVHRAGNRVRERPVSVANDTQTLDVADHGGVAAGQRRGMRQRENRLVPERLKPWQRAVLAGLISRSPDISVEDRPPSGAKPRHFAFRTAKDRSASDMLVPQIQAKQPKSMSCAIQLPAPIPGVVHTL